MKGKIEKSLGLAALALAVASVLMVSHMVRAGETAGQFPKASVGVHENMTFLGNKAKVINASAAVTGLITGQGILDGVCVSLGSEGDYAIAFDAAGSGVLTIASYSSAITPAVFSKVGSASQTKDGCFFPQGGIKFASGLVGARSSATGLTLFYVHSSTGANPYNPVP